MLKVLPDKAIDREEKAGRGREGRKRGEENKGGRGIGALAPER